MGSGLSPEVLVVTFRVPVAVEQSMVKGTLTVCPVITVTGREGPPVTEQLDAIPLRVTVWLPVARFAKVAVPLGSMC